MSDQVLEHEETTEPTIEDQVVDAVAELRGTPEAETGEPIVVDEEVASTDATPEVEAPPSEDDAEEPTQALQDEEPEPTEEELRYARTVLREFRERPELGDALVALKQGRATLIDKQVIEAAQRYMQEQQAPPAETEDPSDRFYSDPAAYVQSLEQRLNEVLSWREQESQARVRMESESNGNLLVSTGEEWQSKHPELSEEQVKAVVGAVSETGLIRRYLRQHGDKKRAIQDALEAGLRMEFPDLAKAAAQNEAIRRANRDRRARATAASPRSVPRTTEEERPLTRAGKREYLAKLIAEERQAQL